MTADVCTRRHRQGYDLTPGELQRILQLLRDTDVAMPLIASRMDCSRSAIAAINKKFGVRHYEGRRLWSPEGL